MKDVLKFLKELRENNNRDWFAAQKPQFEECKSAVKKFAENVKLDLAKHDRIEDKAKVFRIYRDVRFSADKTPYKTHFACSFTREGADRRGGYYCHIQPGNSFVGGGFFQPNKEDLKLIRLQIQQDAQPLKEVIDGADFRNYFTELEGDKVKTAPKGFSKDEENIDLIRFKSFLCTHHFTDDEVKQEDFSNKVSEGFQKMFPFFDVMTEYLTTDLNGETLI